MTYLKAGTAGAFFAAAAIAAAFFAFSVTAVSASETSVLAEGVAPAAYPEAAYWRVGRLGQAVWLAEKSEIPSFPAGVPSVTGDLDGDGLEETVTGSGPGEEPSVSVFRPDGSLIRKFPAYDPGMRHGVNAAVGDVDGDGRPEIVIGTGSGAVAHVLILDGEGRMKAPAGGFFPFGREFRGGVTVSVGNPAGSDSAVILVAPADSDGVGRAFAPKFVSVDVSEQRLRAYEYGREVRTFLVSTGTARHPTPLGDFSVLAKVPEVIYRWTYGPDSPDNYDLGRTPWNLRILPHIYIHYAPWHDNFGRRVSHGCINVNLGNIRWLYDWAEVGMPVTIVD
ncbi:L,D-transpeptidase family protein [Candidatus Uhrbacteria bacterium]|nr:L,D-transpeptidase family protein [Candidatus Uhrbacteria bacterium]